MVCAWYANVQSNGQDERFLNVEELFQLTGVEYFEVNFSFVLNTKHFSKVLEIEVESFMVKVIKLIQRKVDFVQSCYSFI